MLKKILRYFEMLIVPHALHCVDSCIWHTVLVSVPPPPLSDLASLSKFTYRELTVRVVGLPPPPIPQIFLSDLVLAPSSLHQPPPQRLYGEGILLSYGLILPRLRCSCLDYCMKHHFCPKLLRRNCFCC